MNARCGRPTMLATDEKNETVKKIVIKNCGISLMAYNFLRYFGHEACGHRIHRTWTPATFTFHKSEKTNERTQLSHTLIRYVLRIGKALAQVFCI